jgi:hypothetical protein
MRLPRSHGRAYVMPPLFALQPRSGDDQIGRLALKNELSDAAFARDCDAGLNIVLSLAPRGMPVAPIVWCGKRVTGLDAQDEQGVGLRSRGRQDGRKP